MHRAHRRGERRSRRRHGAHRGVEWRAVAAAPRRRGARVGRFTFDARAASRARAHGAERRLNTSRRPIDTSTSDDSRVPPARGVHAEAEKIFRESADRARARASTTRESTTRRGATPDARRGRESVIVTAVLARTDRARGRAARTRTRRTRAVARLSNERTNARARDATRTRDARRRRDDAKKTTPTR